MPELIGLSAPHARKPEAPVLLISHGYENIYERGFCNGLFDVGFDFLLISSDQTDYPGLRSGMRTLNLRGSQLAQRSRWQKAANLLRYHLRLMLCVTRLRPRLVHVFGLIEPVILCGLVEGLWIRLWTSRYVLTVHDIEPHDRGNTWNRWLYALSFRLASFLVVHTKQLRDELVTRHGIAASRVLVMEHGIEPLAQPPALSSGGVVPKPFRLLVFGKIMHYKGVDLLVQALRGFPHDFELTIAGRSTDPAIAAELRSQIATHPNASAIHWNDAYVPESTIPQLFTDADALVLAYRRIDQSGVLFQALRFGLPVVAARVGALQCYVEQEVGEICEPGDVASLRAALLRLLARYPSIDREQVRAFGRRFEWQHTVPVLRGLYGD